MFNIKSNQQSDSENIIKYNEDKITVLKEQIDAKNMMLKISDKIIEDGNIEMNKLKTGLHNDKDYIRKLESELNQLQNIKNKKDQDIYYRDIDIMQLKNKLNNENL